VHAAVEVEVEVAEKDARREGGTGTSDENDKEDGDTKDEEE